MEDESHPLRTSPSPTERPTTSFLQRCRQRLSTTRRPPRRVPLVDRFELDPWQRWMRHGAFPRSLVLHVLLVALATAQSVFLVKTTSAFSANVHDSLVAWLFPEDVADLAGNPLTFPEDRFYLHTVEDFNRTLHSVFTAYFALASTAPAAAAGEATRRPGGFATASPPFLPPVTRGFLSSSGRGVGGEAASGRRTRRGQSRRRPSSPPLTHTAPASASASADDDDPAPSPPFGPLGIPDVVEIYQEGVSSPLRPPSLSFSLVYGGEYHSVGPASAAAASSRSAAGAGEGVPETRPLEETVVFQTLQDFYDWMADAFPNPDSQTGFLHSLLSLSGDLQLRIFNYGAAGYTAGVCTLWDVGVVFDFSARGSPSVSLDDDFSTCQTGWDASSKGEGSGDGRPSSPSPLLVTSAFLLAAAVLQQILTLREAARVGRLVLWASNLGAASRYVARTRARARVRRRASSIALVRSDSRSSFGGASARNLTALAGLSTPRSEVASEDGGLTPRSAGDAGDDTDDDDGSVPRVHLGVWPVLRAVLCCCRPGEDEDTLAFEKEEEEGMWRPRSLSESSVSSAGTDSSGFAGSPHASEGEGGDGGVDGGSVHTSLSPTPLARSASGSGTGMRLSRRSNADRSMSSLGTSVREDVRLVSMAQAAALASAGIGVGSVDGGVEGQSESGLHVRATRASPGHGEISERRSDQRLSRTTSLALLDQDEYARAVAREGDATGGGPGPGGPGRARNKRLRRAISRLKSAAALVTPARTTSLLSPWLIISFLGESFLVLYSVWCLVVGEVAIPDEVNQLLAFGAALEWAALAKYVRHHGSLSLFERAFASAIPSVLRNFAATIPIFLSFATLVTMLFGDLTERFDGVIWSSISLFAVSNGDVIRETFQVSVQYEPTTLLRVVAQLVLYAYCVSFIYVMLKTTTAIIEESYLLTRPPPPEANGESKVYAIPGISNLAQEGDSEGGPGRGGAGGEDVDVDGEPGGVPSSSPSPSRESYMLKRHIRALLLAMQEVRDAGGRVSTIVREAVRAVPVHARLHALEGLSWGLGEDGEEADADVEGADGAGVQARSRDFFEGMPPISPGTLGIDLVRRIQWFVVRAVSVALGLHGDLDDDVVGAGLAASDGGVGTGQDDDDDHGGDVEVAGGRRVGYGTLS
jgi:hypothetical protein